MLAPAKVNLFLHVDRAKSNGRHNLDSLVMFAGAEASDRLEARKTDALSLSLHGPFAGPELASPENLVLRTIAACEARGLKVPPLSIGLHKHIPVAAGLGGGSADAGATLRLLVRHGSLTDSVAMTIASSLGGDVPVALLSTPCLMRGEGEHVTPMRHVPDLAALLVNPGIACPTGAVFQAFDNGEYKPEFELVDLPVGLGADELVSWLRASTRNDLEAPAIALVPDIGNVLDELRTQPGCQLSRMSGSGASCFGLFSSRHALKDAAAAMRARHPGWWIAPTLLAGTVTP